MAEQANQGKAPVTEEVAAQAQPLTWGPSRRIMAQLGTVLLLAACWGLILAVVIGPHQVSAPPSVSEGEALSWENHIYPIMEKNCVICHGSSGGLSLTSLDHALAGGISGPVIVPGDAENSLLYQLLQGPVGNIPSMPLGRPKLPQSTIDIIGQWIDQLPPTS